MLSFQGERFTYRLRSIRDIIKNISTDSEPQSKKDVDDSSKKSRRSSLRSGKRKSIVNTVLRRNFKLSVEVNSVDDAVERKAEKETEEQENVSTNDTLTERGVSDCEMLANEQKTKQTNVEKGEGIQQVHFHSIYLPISAKICCQMDIALLSQMIFGIKMLYLPVLLIHTCT